VKHLPRTQKIFGIGLSRTGTTSLHAALERLGFRSCHYPPLDRLLEIVESCDAVDDTSVACSFRELDALYPGSRFILTVRDIQSWLASTERFFAKDPHPVESWRQEVRLRIYGVLRWDREAFEAAYHRHFETVLAHFRNRRSALLIMDIAAGDGWDVLCPFLNVPTPDEVFPREHVFPTPPRDNL
jgi:Sulfotransferase domain